MITTFRKPRKRWAPGFLPTGPIAARGDGSVAANAYPRLPSIEPVGMAAFGISACGDALVRTIRASAGSRESLACGRRRLTEPIDAAQFARAFRAAFESCGAWTRNHRGRGLATPWKWLAAASCRTGSYSALVLIGRNLLATGLSAARTRGTSTAFHR